MIYYRKLVRDNIPAIIEESGEIPVTRTLDEQEYITELQRKLMEEVAEYVESNTTDELVDILEVLRALSVVHDTSLTKLEVLRKQKAQKRGGFTNRTFLVSVEAAA